MKQKQLFITGTALALAAALAGCGAVAPAADQNQARQPSYISMAQAQTAALDAANIDAASADISSSTLDEVAGVSCYKVEFTAGGRAYDYSINAETGEVLEMSVHDEAAAPADAPQTDVPVSGTATAPASGTTTAPASSSSHAASTSVQAAPNTNASAGKVDEARAKEIALNHAGVKAADATVTKPSWTMTMAVRSTRSNSMSAAAAATPSTITRSKQPPARSSATTTTQRATRRPLRAPTPA